MVSGYLILGVLIIRILQFRVLYQGPLFSETPAFVMLTVEHAPPNGEFTGGVWCRASTKIYL